MMVRFLDLHKQYLSMKSEIDAAIAAVIERSAYIGGEFARRFEQEFAAYQQAAHCVGVGNGTDAIEIVLEALGLPAGSEVVVPANSFIASAEAVTRSGHRVRFCDVDPATATLSPGQLKACITDSTKAVIVVHLYGLPCDMDGILAVAREHGLNVIEDCAQAHGAEYKGRRVGTIGDAGTFSFYPGKNLGAYGDAGAIVTNDESLAVKCRMIANHGRIAKYDHEFEGRNSRLDGMQAAVLSVKLRHLERWLARRIDLAARYREGLAGIEGLDMHAVPDHVRHVYHLFVVRTARRDALQRHLKDAGIETGIHYPIALPHLAAYRHLHQQDDTPVACSHAHELLSLPIGEHLGASDVDRVIAELRGFFGR